MLFSSSDGLQVDLLRHRLGDAGIACETRLSDAVQAESVLPSYPELWVRNDSDFPTALMVFMSWYRQRKWSQRC